MLPVIGFPAKDSELSSTTYRRHIYHSRVTRLRRRNKDIAAVHRSRSYVRFANAPRVEGMLPSSEQSANWRF